jgi:hypothetical protein
MYLGSRLWHFAAISEVLGERRTSIFRVVKIGNHMQDYTTSWPRSSQRTKKKSPGYTKTRWKKMVKYTLCWSNTFVVPGVCFLNTHICMYCTFSLSFTAMEAIPAVLILLNVDLFECIFKNYLNLRHVKIDWRRNSFNLLQPWIWRQYVPLRCRCYHHDDVATQKIFTDIFTAVGTSNPMQNYDASSGVLRGFQWRYIDPMKPTYV